jgi:hypothetical protein
VEQLDKVIKEIRKLMLEWAEETIRNKKLDEGKTARAMRMQEHRQQQASAEVEDSWDKRQRISTHCKSVLRCFEINVRMLMK